MKVDGVLRVIPHGVRVAAVITGCLVVVAGWSGGFWAATHNDGGIALVFYGMAAVIGGLMVTTWILGVGYVYADARRRGMRPGLWAVLVVLFPHLLGFLLYFVMRQPLALVCGACGQSVSPTQRFCSWCGAMQGRTEMSGGTRAAGPSSGVSL